MRSLSTIILMFAVMVLQPVFAESSLHMKLNGNLKNMYLYMETLGCVNIEAGTKGYVFPLQKGQVHSIVLVDRTTWRMYPQKLPASCKIAIDSQNKKVTVSGTISPSVSDHIAIKNLQCTTT